MAESEDPVAVDVGRRSDRGHIEVAADELDARRRRPSRREAAAGRVGGLGLRRRSRPGGPGSPGGRRTSWALSKARRRKNRRRRAAARGARRVNPLPRPPRPVASASRNVPESSSWVMPSRMMTARGGARRGFFRRRADGEHLLDRRDPGDGLLGEAEAVGDGADELAVDIDGAAAHAADDAGRFEAAALEPGQDDVALGRGSCPGRRGSRPRNPR